MMSKRTQKESGEERVTAKSRLMMNLIARTPSLVSSSTSVSPVKRCYNFTRDEWNNLLHLFNISHFSSTCCAKNSSLISCSKTMAKRMQEQKGEERSVAKSKSTAMNLSSHVPTSSSSAKSLIASKSPGDTHIYRES